MATRTLKDKNAPYALLAVGVGIIVGRQLLRSGPIDAVAAFGWLAITAIVGIALMAIGCLVTGKLLGTSFGNLGPALLKLAAIYLFPTAAASLLPPGWSALVATALYFALLLWLFDLEIYEAAVFTLVMILIRWAIFTFQNGFPIPFHT